MGWSNEPDLPPNEGSPPCQGPSAVPPRHTGASGGGCVNYDRMWATIIVTITILVIICAGFMTGFILMGEPELVGEGIVQDMHIEHSLKKAYLITIMDKEYLVNKSDYYLVDVGDNIQLWKRPGSTRSSITIIDGVVP